VSLALAGLPATVTTAKLTHYRIDEHHSNAYAEWRRMGSPIAPDRKQYAELEQAGELATLDDAPATVPVSSGRATLDFALPRQAVSLLLLEWN
jgi:xylan 1,4-beta-xylosidase